MSTHPDNAATPPLRIGFVGGGVGSNIGETHRAASRLDGLYETVTGVFSTEPEKNRVLADRLGIAEDRRYAHYEAMAEAEADRPDGIDVVAILTPNNLHAPVAKPFLERGIHVFCEKPATTSFDDAVDLARRVARGNCVFGLAHAYAYYAMVHEARERILGGEIGKVRLVHTEYAAGWAARPLELEGHKQASWRTDPEIGGPSAVVGDLGTHAHHLARFVTGLEITEVSAELSTLVPERKSDDTAHVLIRMDNGARGVLWTSMAATGNNSGGLWIRVFGENGSIHWHQEQPERLVIRTLDQTERLVKRGDPTNGEAANRLTRRRPGQPEGFLSAFANLYRDVAIEIRARRQPDAPATAPVFPNAVDGAVGMGFVEAVVQSSAADSRWTRAPVPSDIDLSGD